MSRCALMSVAPWGNWPFSENLPRYKSAAPIDTRAHGGKLNRSRRQSRLGAMLLNSTTSAKRRLPIVHILMGRRCGSCAIFLPGHLRPLLTASGNTAEVADLLRQVTPQHCYILHFGQQSPRRHVLTHTCVHACESSREAEAEDEEGRQRERGRARGSTSACVKVRASGRAGAWTVLLVKGVLRTSK